MSFAGTAKLICAFVFAYAKDRFSHDVFSRSPRIDVDFSNLNVFYRPWFKLNLYDVDVEIHALYCDI